MGGSSEETKSSQTPVPLRESEKEFEQVQLDFVRKALEAYNLQFGYQQQQAGLGTGAMEALGGVADPLTALSEEERAGLVQRYYDQALTGGARAEEISEIEMDRIRRGGVASPEQLANIQATYGAELETGLGDISRFATQQREAVGSELAPRLGLHRSDTPILDRGNRIGAEALNAASRLVSDVRGREAQARLSYPLAASQAESQMNQAQQGINWSRSDVLAQLNQQAFQNRLALTGQVGQQGLGLSTSYNVPAGQESLKPTLATETSGWKEGGGVLYGSSWLIKEILGTPNGADILAKLRDLPVAFWKYLEGEGDDREDHIGTFSESFKEAFDLGDGKTIDLRDMVGVLLVGLQELAGKVQALRAEEGA